MLKEKGITLITLIITIIVMLILVSVTISLTIKGGLIQSTQEAAFKTNISKWSEELEVYKTNNPDDEDIYADGADVKTYIPSITNKYIGTLRIFDNELQYIIKDGGDENESVWAGEINIDVISEGDTYWATDGNGTITGYNGPAVVGTVTIPSEINGVTITTIGEGSLSGIDVIGFYTDMEEQNLNPDEIIQTELGSFLSGETEFITPEYIASIPNSKFAPYINNIGYAKQIVLPNTITTLSTMSFNQCVNLQSINLPNSLDTIGYNAFWSCLKLNNIVIPSGVTRIESMAFSDCFSLTNITLPDGLEEIGQEAFQATAFESITLPNSINSLETNAFLNCASLKTIIIEMTQSEWNSNVTTGSSWYGECSSSRIGGISNNVVYFNTSLITAQEIETSY